MTPPRVLIVAGSDSGGGAGIQADIRTVTMLGGFAMTAVTALTAQNTLGVEGVMAVPADFVIRQVEAVLSDIGADIIKIGMVGSAETAAALAERLPDNVPVVFDPVMVATSGSTLADAATIAAFERLMGKAALVTPNVPELEALTGRRLDSLAAIEAAAAALALRTKAVVLAKGGHLEGPTVVDLLVSPHATVGRWESERIDTVHTHGTGCTLASAIATLLAFGLPLRAAVVRARQFVIMALRDAPGLGGGHGPMGHHKVRLDLGGELRLNQVTLPAHDFDTSFRFYEALGLTAIVSSPPRYARFECEGGATLSIELGGEAGSGGVYFECTDLDAVVAGLRGRGIEVADPAERSWLWREAWLADPAGNRLCLYQADINRRFPPWRLPAR
ncbi:MAG TPA: bifunctional hydroxymethylpyrimidine kinase/phosphomethylpyrimidine kinase [Allosphingosinicella sp.]